MKRTILSFTILLLTFFSTVSAQDDVSVSVCVGEQRLSDLLTEEQKNTVTHLMITGTMAEEDYAFIRTNRLKRIVELNLRDADIETLPEHAFDFEWSGDKWKKTMVLPLKLKYLSDYSLCVTDCSCTYILTGAYPKLGFNVYHSDLSKYMLEMIYIYPSEDNAFLKSEGDFVYSKDGTIVYYYNENYNDITDIADGTRIISGNLFENSTTFFRLIIPETVDSVGDRTFAGVTTWVTTNDDYHWGYITCLAKNPPRLGKDVFLIHKYLGMDDGLVLYVPDESVELYKKTDGWNIFEYIYPISEFRGGIDGINGVYKDGTLTVHEKGDGYVLKSPRCIDNVTGYDVSGRNIYSNDIDAKTMSISKSSLVTPFTILRVRYKDGTNETIKLKP